MIELYTRASCQSCVVAKRFLTEKNVPFKEYSVGVDVQREDVLKKFPVARMLPIVVIEGEYVGSKEELIEWYRNYVPTTGDAT